jgi:sugar diacid utilization regulator
LINSKAFDKRSIAANIVVDNRIVGYLIVVEMEKPFEEDDIELIDLLNSVVSSEMKKDQFISSSRGNMHEYFLVDILDGKIKGGKAVRERLKSLNWGMEGRMHVITVLVKEQDAARTPMFYVRDVLGSMFSRSRCIVYNNNIVIFVNHKSDDAQFEDELKYLASFLEDNEMRCAVSRGFSNPVEMRKHYIQTLKCLELGSLIDDEEVVFRYEDYVVHHILSCCLPQVNLMDFCHPLILELMGYDRKNNTDYTLSLYMYIKNGRKKIETANELHIHRNTMSYRVDRIMKILNVDLDNSDLIFQFLISFKILEYVNESNFAEIMAHPRSAL